MDAVYGGVVRPEDVLDELAGRAEASPDELRHSPSFVAMDGRVVQSFALGRADIIVVTVIGAAIGVSLELS